MKSVGYLLEKSTNNIYTFVVYVTPHMNKLDILNANSVDAFELAGAVRYTPDKIFNSVIYTKLSTVKYVYGTSSIYKRSFHKLEEKELYSLLINGNIHDIETDEFLIVPVSILTNGGSANKQKGLSYEIIKKANYLVKHTYITGRYAESESGRIKTLEYFEQSKNLNLESKDYRCLKSYEEVQEYVDSVDWDEVEYTAKDTETTSLIFFKNLIEGKIVGMSHSYRDKQGVYIPFNYMGDKMLDPQKVFEIMKPAYEKTRQVFQNGPFDYRVFRTYDIIERLDEELTVLLRLINPSEIYPIDLKYTARLLLGEETIELDEILGSGFDPKLVEYIPLDLMTVYACGDADYTLRVFKKMIKQIPEEMVSLYRETMRSFQEVNYTDWVGLPARQSILNNLIDQTSRDVAILEEFTLDYIEKTATTMYLESILKARDVDVKKMNKSDFMKLLNSAEFKQMTKNLVRGTRRLKLELNYARDKHKIFYELLDYPKLRYTKAGALSTGKDYFDDINVYEYDEPKDIFTTDIYSFNKRTKLIDKDIANKKVFPLGYIMKVFSSKSHELDMYKKLQEMHSGDYTYNPYKFNGTVTGRLSGVVHTIPTYAKKAIGFEDESEWGFCDFDFDQVELRAVHNEAIRMWEGLKNVPEIKNNPKHIVNTYDYSNIVNIFNSFYKDPHSEMTADFSRCPVSKVTKQMRSKGKAVNFASVYGGTEYTMSRNEMKYAKTQEQREEILESYATTKNSMYCTFLHLLNYLNTAKKVGLIPIEPSKIPYNINSMNVGMSVSRSGRRRFYPLDDMTTKLMRHIENACCNQPIQSYARDVVFKAICDIADYLRKSGLTEEDIFYVLYVHDEAGLVYNKKKINPLWLAAVIHYFCKMKFEGSPIYYYSTTSIASNWGEAKTQEKYEAPKEMLDGLSIDYNDYPLLDTLDHKGYMLEKITSFYRHKIWSLCKNTAMGKEVDLSKFDFEENYFILGKLKMYIEGTTEVSVNANINNILNLIYFIKDEIEDEGYSVLIDGKKVDWSTVIKEDSKQVDEVEDEVPEDFLDFDLESLLDSDDTMMELSKSNSIEESEEFSIDNSALVASTINRKTLMELDSKFINVTKSKRKNQNVFLKNIVVEEFTFSATINIGFLSGTEITQQSFKKINKILKECAIDQMLPGYDITYLLNESVVDSNIRVPISFKFKKFDDFINSVRTKI